MTQFPNDQGLWIPCAPGSLTQYALRRRQRRRRLAAARAVGAVATVLLALAVGWELLHKQKEDNIGGIACHDVERLIPQYLRGGLSSEERDKIRRHLAECPDCGEMLRRLKQAHMPGSGEPFVNDDAVRLAANLEPEMRE